MKPQPTLFLDNVQFRYDAEKGLFCCLSWASEDVTLEEVRRRGMTLSLYEVTVVRGIPYLFDERTDILYRLGNVNERLTGDEFEMEDRQGTVSYPYGEAFRDVVRKEKAYATERQWSERDR